MSNGFRLPNPVDIARAEAERRQAAQVQGPHPIAVLADYLKLPVPVLRELAPRLDSCACGEPGCSGTRVLLDGVMHFLAGIGPAMTVRKPMPGMPGVTPKPVAGEPEDAPDADKPKIIQ